MKRFYSMSILLLWLGVSSQLLAQSQLVFTEIMYNPAESGSDSTEYVEIFNNGDAAIVLTDYYISSGFVYTFPEVTIPAQGYFVLSSDSLAMVNTYGFEGSYEWSTGTLLNGGESLALKDSDGNLLDSLKYDDTAAWPDEADQGGSSLILCDPNSDNILPENWSFSTLSAGIIVNEFEVFGSPGAIDPACICESYSDIEIEACDAYSSPSGIYIWIETGIYYDTIPNVAECDSIITIDLTISESKIYTDVRLSCVPLEWIDGITYTESNNTAFVNLMTTEGCDSMVSLDLIISDEINVIDHINACGPYTWIDGIEYTENNSTSTQTYTSVDGCDSIVRLNLVINNPTESISIYEVCEIFEWIDGNTYTESNNSATFTIENVAGCDSIINLDLTILKTSEYIDVQETCESFEWIDGNTYSESNNTATFTIENTAGCDSIISLDLTINTVNVSVILEGASITAILSGATYQWVNCDNNYYFIEGENEQSFTPITNANYAVVITENNCRDTSECVNITGIGIEERTGTMDVQIYPNPASDKINITLNKIMDAEVSVCNIAGKAFIKYTLEGKSNFDLSISNLEAGVYFVKIQSKDGLKIKKLIKQ